MSKVSKVFIDSITKNVKGMAGRDNSLVLGKDIQRQRRTGENHDCTFNENSLLQH